MLKITLTASSNDLKRKFANAYLGNKYKHQFPVEIGLSPKIHMIDNSQVVTHLVHNISKSPTWNEINAIYMGSSGGIILFDRSDLKSFEAVYDLVEEFRKKIPTPNKPLVLVGVDTNTKNINTEEGKALAKQLNLTYFETASPTFQNLEEIFIHLAREVMKIRGNPL